VSIATTAKALLLLTLPFGLIPAGADLTVEEARNRLSSPPAPVEDLTWHGQVDLTLRGAGPKGPSVVTLFLEGAAKQPDKAKITLSSHRATAHFPDFFADKVGLTYLLNGHHLTTYEPFSGRIRTYDLRHPLPVRPYRLYGSGDLPDVEPFLQGMLRLMTRPAPDALKHVGTETLEGQSTYVFAEQWDAPAPLARAAEAAQRKYWVDVREGKLLQVAVYNAGGALLRQTQYRAFVPLGEGYWAATESETTIPAREIPVWLDVSQTGTNEPTVKTIQKVLPLSARTIRTTFAWVEEVALLPQRIEVVDAEGNASMRVIFFGYRFNTGLPETIFEWSLAPFQEPPER